MENDFYQDAPRGCKHMKSKFNKDVLVVNSGWKEPQPGQYASFRRKIVISVILTGLTCPIAGWTLSPIDYETDTLEVLLRTGTHFVLIGTPHKLWHLGEGDYRESLELIDKKVKTPSSAPYSNERSSDAKAVRSCESSEAPSSGCLYFLEFSVKRVAFTSPRAGFKLPSDTKTIYLALGTLSYIKDELGAWQQTIGKEAVMLTTSTRENSNSSLPLIHQPVRSFSWRGRLPMPIIDYPEIEKAARNLGFIEFRENK